MIEKFYTRADNDGKSILVFGSNLSGIHGAGAAHEAHFNWGARWGVGVGRTGMAYAIPTKDRNVRDSLSVNAVAIFVGQFLEYARQHPELKFLVTKIGCGLAALPESEIAPLFGGAPKNCVLPDGWFSFSANRINKGATECPHCLATDVED